jgi:hypothetical protein
VSYGSVEIFTPLGSKPQSVGLVSLSDLFESTMHGVFRVDEVSVVWKRSIELAVVYCALLT